MKYTQPSLSLWKLGEIGLNNKWEGLAVRFYRSAKNFQLYSMESLKTHITSGKLCNWFRINDKCSMKDLKSEGKWDRH